MNWSGGYKHRFRPSTEIRKTAFQQQSRIILVDLVRDDDHEKANENNGQNFPMIPPKIETVSKDGIAIRHFGIGTPFDNIPCGSSSDTEGSRNDELSNTNYSPFSLDQESSAEHTIANMSEGDKIKVPSSHKIDEDSEDSNPNEVSLPQKSSLQSEFGSFISNLSSECLTPPYLNRNPYSSTLSLSFLTPVISHENVVEHSVIDRRFCQQDLGHNSNLNNLPFSTSLIDKTVIQENSIFKNRIQTNNRKALSTKKCPMSVPVGVIPAPRKQVHFDSSDRENITVKNFYEENQANALGPAAEQYASPDVGSPRNNCTLSTSTVRCSTPTSYYLNQHFHYPTPTLGSSTTATHHKNHIGFSAKEQRIPGLKDSTLQDVPYSTWINTDKKKKKNVFKTPERSNAVNHNNPSRANCQRFPPLVVTPAQQRRVQLATSVPSKKTKVIVNNTVPVKEISNLNTPMPGTSFTNESAMDFVKYMKSISPPKEEQSVVITEGIISAQNESCKETIYLVRSPSKIVTTYSVPPLMLPQDRTTNTNENLNNQTNSKFTTRKKKQCAARKKTSLSKSLNGGCKQHCRCRTVIRKIKIRDATTQTSP